MKLLENASIGRGRSVLIRNVSLEIEPGTLTRLVGKNGVGKTTLLHTLMGFLPVLEGTRSPDLPDPTTSPHQEAIGYMPSSVPRLPSLTLTQWLKALAVGYQRDLADVQEIWQAVGGRALPKTMLAELSSGNLRKAMFTAACAIQRELLVLDEPFDEVDTEGQQAMAQIIEGQRAGGTSILVVSHRDISQLLQITATYEISEEHFHAIS